MSSAAMMRYKSFDTRGFFFSESAGCSVSSGISCTGGASFLRSACFFSASCFFLAILFSLIPRYKIGIQNIYPTEPQALYLRFVKDLF